MLIDLQKLVDDLVRDDTDTITPVHRDEAVTRAIARYNRDRPNVTVEDVDAPGGNRLELPEAWEQDYSEIRAVEFPIGSVPPELISAENYSLYQTPDGIELQIINAIAAAQLVRFTFTTRHVVNAESDTTPADHREPIACWAAALLCDQLSAHYAKSTNSTINVDSVDHRTKAQEYASRAKTLRGRYFDELGLEEKKNVAAGTVVSLESRDSLGGPRLTHPMRPR